MDAPEVPGQRPSRVASPGDVERKRMSGV